MNNIQIRKIIIDIANALKDLKSKQDILSVKFDNHLQHHEKMEGWLKWGMGVIFPLFTAILVFLLNKII